MQRILEICVDSPAGLDAALKGGADRIELCAALGLGGLTPSAGLLALAQQSPVPVMAMVRPRAGDFCWSPQEVSAMEVEIAAIARSGLAGVVIGATVSAEHPQLDSETLGHLCAAAGSLDITLHRCIDLLEDPFDAIDLAVELGVSRILTSGGATTALDGIDRLKAMQDYASDRLVIMPGAGVSKHTLPELRKSLQLTEVHASASLPVQPDAALAGFGFQPEEARVTDASTVSELKRLLR